MREDDFIGQQFTWYTGIIEDIDDPLILNRVKVRCIGFHSMDKAVLATDDLPWATVIMPNTAASYQGIGANHHLEVGSWVVGFFRDGSSAQDPMVMGSIATQENGVLDIPVESQLNPPSNKVYRSKAGHLIELDNTEGSERISITHKKGTTILIDKDGGIQINAINDIINIDGNTTITGKLDVTGEVTAKAGSTATDDNGQPILDENGGETSGSVTLTGHTHVEVPGTGGSSSPTPATQETKSPTKGT